MTPEQKQRLDDMSYREMLHMIRFAPMGNVMFLWEADKDRERQEMSLISLYGRREIDDG